MHSGSPSKFTTTSLFLFGISMVYFLTYVKSKTYVCMFELMRQFYPKEKITFSNFKFSSLGFIFIFSLEPGIISSKKINQLYYNTYKGIHFINWWDIVIIQQFCVTTIIVTFQCQLGLGILSSPTTMLIRKTEISLVLGVLRSMLYLTLPLS